jgi:hypothetical protein
MIYLIKNIENSSSLSDESKESYKKIIKKIIRLADTNDSKELEWKGSSEEEAIYNIIINPDKFNKYIEKEENIKTRNLYYNTIISLFKHSNNPENLQKYKTKWYELSITTKEQIKEDEINHIITDKQKSAMISWENVLLKLKSLKGGSKNHLLLTTYITITRRQSDYASVKIINSDEEIPENHSYINLNPTNKKPYIYIIKGKTIKYYDNKFEEELPTKMLSSLKSSLKREPREYLFGDKSSNTFQKWCNDQLKRIFENKNMTVNILRHSHAEYIDRKPNIKMKEREKEARLMGHSVNRQLLYNLYQVK